VLATLDLEGRDMQNLTANGAAKDISAEKHILALRIRLGNTRPYNPMHARAHTHICAINTGSVSNKRFYS